ncbi:hypothetical protein D9M69_728870 [compost metagenome]
MGGRAVGKLDFAHQLGCPERRVGEQLAQPTGGEALGMGRVRDFVGVDDGHESRVEGGQQLGHVETA